MADSTKAGEVGEWEEVGGQIGRAEGSIFFFGGVHQYGWFIMVPNPIKMDDLVVLPLSRWWQLKYFFFSSRKLGRLSSLTSIFFKGVETTN